MTSPPPACPPPDPPPPGRMVRWLRTVGERLEALNPCARVQSKNPEQELRFTRDAQGRRWGIAAVAALALATGCLLGLFIAPPDASAVPLWVSAALTAAVAAACTWIAIYCLSHAFLILSPVGVEIFPFFYPSRGLQVILWQEIGNARIEGGHLMLDFPSGGGIGLSLAPLGPRNRILLIEAIDRRINDQKNSTA